MAGHSRRGRGNGHQGNQHQRNRSNADSHDGSSYGSTNYNGGHHDNSRDNDQSSASSADGDFDEDRSMLSLGDSIAGFEITWKELMLAAIGICVLALLSVIIGVAAGMTISIHYYDINNNPMYAAMQFDPGDPTAIFYVNRLGTYRRATTLDPTIASRNHLQPKGRKGLDLGKVITSNQYGQLDLLMVVEESPPVRLHQRYHHDHHVDADGNVDGNYDGNYDGSSGDGMDGSHMPPSSSNQYNANHARAAAEGGSTTSSVSSQSGFQSQMEASSGNARYADCTNAYGGPMASGGDPNGRCRQSRSSNEDLAARGNGSGATDQIPNSQSWNSNGSRRKRTRRSLDSAEMYETPGATKSVPFMEIRESSVHPIQCPGPQSTFGFGTWKSLKAAVQEANAMSAERFMKWNQYFARSGKAFTTFQDDALYYEEDVFITICPSSILRARRGPIFINAENILIECEQCTIDVGGTHFAFGPHAKNVVVRGITFRNAHSSSLTFFHDGAQASFEDCRWEGNSGIATQYGGVADVNSTSTVTFYRCELGQANPNVHSSTNAGFISSLSIRG